MKILIIDSCQVNYEDDRGGVHEESGAIVEVTKEIAGKLTTAKRALYVEKKDDPFKDGRFTASAEMIKAAERLAKSKKKTTEAPVVPDPLPDGDPNQGQ